MQNFSDIISKIDSFLWGPAMLFLLVGTGVFLTFRTRFLCWKNLGYALKSTLSKEARTTRHGSGDVSPFSVLTTTLAATIGTGNIVGVATAMVAGGPGALVWMWISALFGLTSKFSECMLAVKYREQNEGCEMSGGPMYTMKYAWKHKKLGAAAGWLFACFTVAASLGVGNLTQANSISEALHSTFAFQPWKIGLAITVLSLFILIGGIKSIAKVSSIVVPFMAVFYIIAGLIVILINIKNLPSGIALIFQSAFQLSAVSGGVLGTIVASCSNAMQYGIARGVFSNEAGMGSAAITAAAAATNHPVRQGYISMTGTFWDTLVVCTITGLCIASSGALGTTHVVQDNTYFYESDILMLTSVNDKKEPVVTGYRITMEENDILLTASDGKTAYQLSPCTEAEAGKTDLANHPFAAGSVQEGRLLGTWKDQGGHIFKFYENGTYCREELNTGAVLTLQAFSDTLGNAGGILICISITLFAFSTILGWEYHGEKALEYLLHTRRFNLLYRILFCLTAFIGAITELNLVWNLSDIANALMAIPNLICLLVLSREITAELKNFQPILKKEQGGKNNRS